MNAPVVTYAKLREADPYLDSDFYPSTFWRIAATPFSLITKTACTAKFLLNLSNGLNWYKPFPFEMIDRFSGWLNLSPEYAIGSHFPTFLGTFYQFKDPVVNDAIFKHFRGADSDPEPLFTPSKGATKIFELVVEVFGKECGITKDDTMFTCSQDLSRFYRSWLHNLIGPKTMSEWEEILQEESKATLGEWIAQCREGEQFDLRDAGQYASRIITRLLLDKPIGSKELSKAINVINWFTIKRGTGWVSQADQARYDEALQVFREAINGIVEDASIPLFQPQNGQELTLNQKKALILIIFVGGQETTGFFLANVLLVLAQNPGLQMQLRDLLQNNLEAGKLELHKVFNFVLGMYPPAYGVARVIDPNKTACLEYQFEGEEQIRKLIIPGGTRVTARIIRAAEKVLDTSPEKLQSPGGYQAFSPFGSGPHGCPGRHLALAETMEFIIQTLKRCSITTTEFEEPEIVGRITLQFARAHHVLFTEIQSD